LSDIIEEFIKHMFEESGDSILVIQRNELASYFECAPSQINYVLMTRFSTDKGYYIESKRGGGGSIRITRVCLDSNDYLRHLLEERIGDTITQGTAHSIIDSFMEHGLVTEREVAIMKSVVNDKAIGMQFQDRDYIRAGLLKSMLLILINM
jgi:transcriptional regulator CtsR